MRALLSTGLVFLLSGGFLLLAYLKATPPKSVRLMGWLLVIMGAIATIVPTPGPPVIDPEMQSFAQCLLLTILAGAVAMDGFRARGFVRFFFGTMTVAMFVLIYALAIGNMKVYFGASYAAVATVLASCFQNKQLIVSTWQGRCTCWTFTIVGFLMIAGWRLGLVLPQHPGVVSAWIMGVCLASLLIKPVFNLLHWPKSSLRRAA